MGVWNAGLFSNDTTCDVKDTYIKLLEQQFNNEDAYQKTFEEYEDLMGTDEEPLFWYALADTQWNAGCLLVEVKNTALKFIAIKGGSSLWEGNSQKILSWEHALQKLKEKIESPMPPKKIFKKPVDFERNPWDIGDVYAYQFHTKKSMEHSLSGKYILFQKIGNVEYYEGIAYSVIQVFNRIFDFIPSLDVLEDIRVLPLVCSPKIDGSPSDIENYFPSFEWYLKATMLYENKSHYPKKYLTFIGHMNMPKCNYLGNDFTDFFWDKNKMEDWLIDYYLSWKNIAD